MTDRLALLQEADRRGLLPPDMKSALDEARKRGLVSDAGGKEGSRSYASGLARAAWQGATLSFGDEINAAARAGYSALTGDQDFGSAYDNALNDERDAYREFSDENPVTSFVAGLAGGIAPAIAAPGLAGVRYLQAAKTAGQAAQRGAAVGAGYGAVSGFGSGGGETAGEGLGNRLASGVVGSALGAGLGAGGGYVGHRVGEAIAGAKQARAEVDQSGGAYNAAAKALGRDRVDPADLRDTMLPKVGTKVSKDVAADIVRLADSGQDQAAIAKQTGLSPKTVGSYQRSFRELNETPLTIVDRAALASPGSGQNVQWSMRAAAATPGEARTQAAERLTERQVGQSGRLVDAFQKYIGDGDLEGRIAQLQETVRNQERAAYKAAYASEQPFDLMPVVNNWNQRIAKDRGPLGRALGEAVDAFFDETQVQNQMGTGSFKRLDIAKNLQRFQQGKENLDYLIEQSFKDGRATRLTRMLTQLKGDLMGEVRKTNPAWSQANDLFADGRAADKALTAGEALATTMGSKSREALKSFDKMDATQKELFRQGFSRMLQDRAINKPDGHDVTAQLRTGAARGIIRRVMDRGSAPSGLSKKDANAWNAARRQERSNADALLRVINEEAAGTRTFRALQGGSQTTPLKEAIEDLNAPAYLTSALSYLNPRALGQEVLSQVARRVYSGRNSALMEMLTETNPVKQMEVLEAIQRYSAARSSGGSAADTLIAPVTNSLIAEQRRPGPDTSLRGGIGPRYEAGVAKDPKFAPPMRLGGPKESEQPPRAELRSYTPTPSENAAFYARQGAEAIGVPASQAERVGEGVGAAVNFFTPADDVDDAIRNGSAASAAAAGLSFIPGFRGGKKALEATHAVLKKEIAELEAQAAKLFGEKNVGKILGPNPVPAIPGGTVPTEALVENAQRQKKALQEAIEAKRGELAARPNVQGASVPATTSDQQRAIERTIENNPFVQAIPGRQGFPKKAEQKQLAREFFESGEKLPAAPWGRDAVADVKHALEAAHARGKTVAKQAGDAATRTAEKAQDAAKELEDLRQKYADSVASNIHQRTDLRERLVKAEAAAQHWEEQYKKVWKRLFGDGQN